MWLYSENFLLYISADINQINQTQWFYFILFYCYCTYKVTNNDGDFPDDTTFV